MKHKSSKEVVTINTIKKVGYLIVVGLAVLLIIAATGGNDLPMILSFGVGTILVLIGIALAIWETKTDKPMFYSYGKNWFGGYLNNSAFILGIAVGFYATKVVYGITALGIIAAIYAIITVALKNKSSEAM
ncbi:hypothetical protein [Mogibacterium sp.]